MTLAVATSASTNQAASPTVAATAPASIADGDILVAFVAKNTTTAPSGIPAGWALVSDAGGVWAQTFSSSVSCGANVGTGWAGVYWKEAASEAGTYTWTSSSSTWNVQIARTTGFRSYKPGGILVDDTTFTWARANTRSSTVIGGNTTVPLSVVIADNILLLHQFVQTVAGVTTNFSALPGTMTQIANAAQTGVTQLVAYEYVSMTTNPIFGTRSITTDQTTGGTGGYLVMMPDPSSITGDAQDNRTDTERQSG